MKRHIIRELSVCKFNKVFRGSSVLHFVTHKNGISSSDFNLGFNSGYNSNNVIKNRQLLAEALGLKPENFVFQQQEHTNNVSVVTNNDRGRGFYEHKNGIHENDALITNQKGICLTVFGADCVPILLYDFKKQIIAAIHAGWRGTSLKIVEETIIKMQTDFNCETKNIVAAIGPSISVSNYEVDEIVFDDFKKKYNECSLFFSKGKGEGKYQLDLWKANELQLLKMGLEPENIEIAEICTYDNHHEFFSARRGDRGRFLSGIMLI